MILCHETYRQLAAMTGHAFTVKEIEAALDVAEREFMRPDVAYMTADEAAEWTNDIPEAGWYWRLSAAGYLDCTEWAGPFTSEESAVADMLCTYGDEWVPASMDDWRESLADKEE